MNDDRMHKMGDLAAKVAKAVIDSGLTWDEGIAGLGVAAKAIAIKASMEGAGPQDECITRAQSRFQQGMNKAPAVFKHRAG